MARPAVDLRCSDVAALLASLPDGAMAACIADPPWLYQGGTGDTRRGLAGRQYGGLPDATIAAHMAEAARVTRPDSYLAVWATFPKLLEWTREDARLAAAGWRYVTGAAWGKLSPRGTGPATGVGHHLRGSAELLLLYAKGRPRPHVRDRTARNFWLAPDEEPPAGGLWVAARGAHSVKPQVALRALVQIMTAPGDTVLDLYAGQSASLARACRALGRGYLGAEIDPRLHALACARLSQTEAFSGDDAADDAFTQDGWHWEGA